MIAPLLCVMAGVFALSTPGKSGATDLPGAYVGPAFQRALDTPDVSGAPEDLTLKIRVLFDVGRSEEAWKAVRAFEERFAETKPVKAAIVSMIAGEQLVLFARRTDSASDWKKVRDHFLAFLERYTSDGCLPERVRAAAYIGDSYQRAPYNERTLGNDYYLQAAFQFGEVKRDPPYHVMRRRSDRETRREERREQLVVDRLMRRRNAGTAEAGVFSYLSSANVPTSPFGQDTALGIDPENALGPIMGRVDPYQDESKDLRLDRMRIAVAWSRYVLAMERFRAFQRIEFPGFHGVPGMPPHIWVWWKKEQGPEKIAAAEKWQVDRRRLARWGFWDESKTIPEQMREAIREERIEELDIQFNYWSLHQLTPWIEKKADLLDVATREMAAVAELHVPEWEMAAAARAGDMQKQFYTALRNSPMPPSFKGDQELIEIYRGEMDMKSNWRDVAVGPYAHCLNVATHFRLYNDTALYCEERLNELEPRRYPISHELWISPGREISPAFVQGMIPSAGQLSPGSQ